VNKLDSNEAQQDNSTASKGYSLKNLNQQISNNTTNLNSDIIQNQTIKNLAEANTTNLNLTSDNNTQQNNSTTSKPFENLAEANNITSDLTSDNNTQQIISNTSKTFEDLAEANNITSALTSAINSGKLDKVEEILKSDKLTSDQLHRAFYELLDNIDSSDNKKLAEAVRCNEVKEIEQILNSKHLSLDNFTELFEQNIQTDASHKLKQQITIAKVFINHLHYVDYLKLTSAIASVNVFEVKEILDNTELTENQLDLIFFRACTQMQTIWEISNSGKRSSKEYNYSELQKALKDYEVKKIIEIIKQNNFTKYQLQKAFSSSLQTNINDGPAVANELKNILKITKLIADKLTYNECPDLISAIESCNLEEVKKILQNNALDSRQLQEAFELSLKNIVKNSADSDSKVKATKIAILFAEHKAIDPNCTLPNFINTDIIEDTSLPVPSDGLTYNRGTLEWSNKNVIKLTPLTLAIRMGNIELLKALIEHEKIEVNLKDDTSYYDGYYPLRLAVFNTIYNQKSVDITIQQEKLNTNKEMVKLLLAHKDINVNITDERGLTPLLAAALIAERDDLAQQRDEIVNLLLDSNKCDLSIGSRYKDGYNKNKWNIFHAYPLNFTSGNYGPILIKILQLGGKPIIHVYEDEANRVSNIDFTIFNNQSAHKENYITTVKAYEYINKKYTVNEVLEATKECKVLLESIISDSSKEVNLTKDDKYDIIGDLIVEKFAVDFANKFSTDLCKLLKCEDLKLNYNDEKENIKKIKSAILKEKENAVIKSEIVKIFDKTVANAFNHYAKETTNPGIPGDNFKQHLSHISPAYAIGICKLLIDEVKDLESKKDSIKSLTSNLIDAFSMYGSGAASCSTGSINILLQRVGLDIEDIPTVQPYIKEYQMNKDSKELFQMIVGKIENSILKQKIINSEKLTDFEQQQIVAKFYSIIKEASNDECKELFNKKGINPGTFDPITDDEITECKEFFLTKNFKHTFPLCHDVMQLEFTNKPLRLNYDQTKLIKLLTIFVTDETLKNKMLWGLSISANSVEGENSTKKAIKIALTEMKNALNMELLKTFCYSPNRFDSLEEYNFLNEEIRGSIDVNIFADKFISDYNNTIGKHGFFSILDNKPIYQIDASNENITNNVVYTHTKDNTLKQLLVSKITNTKELTVKLDDIKDISDVLLISKLKANDLIDYIQAEKKVNATADPSTIITKIVKTYKTLISNVKNKLKKLLQSDVSEQNNSNLEMAIKFQEVDNIQKLNNIDQSILETYITKALAAKLQDNDDATTQEFLTEEQEPLTEEQEPLTEEQKQESLAQKQFDLIEQKLNYIIEEVGKDSLSDANFE
jgi:hypothetical protein